ncbi:transposon Ty3-I Gag-Pol polyprotein [Trichonephila clavata]|uniref:Transposon Ty3-I Gag-Pol polyprotein n=1 Tax=Trichonephila clavata TaxID=2740835 RepID=A0A8X6J4C1_TRICU|nr:transposon Ty3-I Gag-Pol polyprotein [Trichonephila clavata]
MDRVIQVTQSIVRLIDDLLKKNAKFLWKTLQKESFSLLKKLLTSGPTLGHFLLNTETKIYFDASGYGIGAILLQIQVDRERPIANAPRFLTAAEKGCLAVIWAIDKFKTVPLQKTLRCCTGSPFFKDSSGSLARWALRLQENDVDITFKSDRKHLDVDSLSRKRLPEAVAKPSDETLSLAAIKNHR